MKSFFPGNAEQLSWIDAWLQQRGKQKLIKNNCLRCIAGTQKKRRSVVLCWFGKSHRKDKLRKKPNVPWECCVNFRVAPGIELRTAASKGKHFTPAPPLPTLEFKLIEKAQLGMPFKGVQSGKCKAKSYSTFTSEHLYKTYFKLPLLFTWQEKKKNK